MKLLGGVAASGPRVVLKTARREAAELLQWPAPGTEVFDTHGDGWQVEQTQEMNAAQGGGEPRTQGTPR